MKPRQLLLLASFFLLSGLVALYVYEQPVTADEASESVTRAIESEVAAVIHEAEQITGSLCACQQLPETNYPFFTYNRGELFCWTDNSVLPPVNLIGRSPSIDFVKVARGNYLLVQQPINDTLQWAAMLKLMREYPVQNEYLNREWNDKIFSTEYFSLVENAEAGSLPITVGGQRLFNLIVNSGKIASKFLAFVCVGCIFLSLLFFLVFVYQWSIHRYSGTTVLLINCFAWIAVRLSLLWAEFPRSWLSFALFSPQQFASSRLNPSLGDLALNVVTVLAVSILVFGHVTKSKWTVELKPTARPVAIAFVFSVLLFTAFYFPVQTLQTIVHNSAIDLDITSSLLFSAERSLAFAIVLLTWVSSFLLVHVLFSRIVQLSGRHLHRVLLGGALVFAAINVWEGQRFLPTLFIGWATVWLMYHFQFLETLQQLQYKTFNYLLVLLLGFSVNAGISIYFLNSEERISNQQRFAESYLADKDAFGEYLLNEASEKISEDAYIQARLGNPFLSKASVEQKVRQVYLPTYFNKFDTRVYLYTASGRNAEDSATAFSQHIAHYQKSAIKTDYQGLYKLHSDEQNSSLQYVLVSPVHRNGYLVGYVLIELSLKRSIPENVYPELLVDNRFRYSLQPASFSYATYSRGSLQSMSGTFNYERDFDIKLLGNPFLFTEGIEVGGFVHSAVESSNETVTVVSSAVMGWQSVVAVVAFYLLLGLGLVLVFLIVIGIVNVVRGSQLYYAARVQVLINLFFFIPLLLVSSITLRILSRSSQEQLNSTYLSRVAFLAEQLQRTDERTTDTEDQLIRLSRVTDSELFLYDNTGRLASSSRASIFESQLKPEVVHAAAFQKMKAGEQSFLIADEVGKLSFNIAFARLSNTNQYLAIPYYQSASVLERIQINALTTILVIFVVVLLVLLSLSYLVSRWLTHPLELITKTLKQTSFEKSNRPLQWKTNDEIGLMVQSYNEMLHNLTESKVELERMQRERTWREIAQQVAHEIKNPLTPMKLTLQRLMRAFQENGWSKEQVEKSMSSVLEQVEVLNGIATSFSTFAKLPVVQLQRVNGAELIRQTVFLFNEQGQLRVTIPDEVWVTADPAVLKTIITNVLLNALQAKHPDREVRVQLTAKKEGQHWQIEIADNGVGIEPEQAERIFLPHFTTKKTGSGLGLAIAKQAIEQMNGTLTFSTTPREGTTFVITIPAAIKDGE